MTFAYRWRRNGVDIAGATASSYTLVTADGDTAITCRVTATDAQGVSASAISNTLVAGPSVITGTGALAAQASHAGGTGVVPTTGTGTLAAQASAVIGSSGTTTVTAPNGQWWKFAGTPTVGTFVNGDPWVLDPGSGVSLIEVSTPTTGSGSTAVHGGMINPTFNTYTEGAMGATITAPMKEGYDGRVGAYASSLIYDATLNAHLSLPRTLVAGDSLVSAVSLLPATAPIGGANPAAYSRMACVTIVNYTPYADEFRPPYFGTVKTRRRYSEANIALMPDLSASSPFNPKGTWGGGFHIDMSSIYVGAPSHALRTGEDDVHINSFRDLQYWILPYGIDQTLCRPLHQQVAYPRDWGYLAGQLSMYTMCAFSDRETFIKRILQVAIDAYAVAVGGGYSGMAPFGAGAGFGYNPLWYVRFAGLLFNDTPMKNAGSISTGKTDYYGGTFYKWGDLNNCYLSTSAHAQYLRVPGEDYTAGFPLYGDAPQTDVSGGVTGNGTTRDPAGVYDMMAYKFGLPTGSYPDILDDTYEHWKVAGVEQTNMGSYMQMLSARQGQVMASIAMGDQAFWGGAVVAMAKRFAQDPQLWVGWGVNWDYSDAFTAPKRANRDVYAAGGTNSEWMLTMWEEIVGIPTGAITGTADLDAQASDVDGAGTVSSGTTTIFNVTLVDDDTGNENFAYRTYCTITGGAGATSKVRCTFEASAGFALRIDNASIGIYDETTPLNCTATPVELLFGGVSGYTFAAGETKISDWVTLGGFTSANHLLVTIDVGSTNGNFRHASGLGGTAYTEFLAATNWYNVQNATGPGGLTGQAFGLKKIEVM